MRIDPHASGIVYLGKQQGLTTFKAGLGAEVIIHRSEPDLPKTTSTPKTTVALPTDEPAAAADAKPTPGQKVINATFLGNASRMVTSLVKMRDDSDGKFAELLGPTELGQFALSMARNLGISEEDAMLLTDAMSRGSLDARALAEGINFLRTLSPGERSSWLSRWLPVARAAAQAIIRRDEDPAMKTLGVSPDIAAALGDLAAINVHLLQNGAKLPAGVTLDDRAADARARTLKRVSSAQGSGVLLAEAAKIGTGDETDDDLRDDFAHDLAARYGMSQEDAYKLVDAMRNRTDVGRMIADGLTKLERLGDDRFAFAESFWHTALAAADAENAMRSDPFTRESGPMSEDAITPMGDLADFIGAMMQYQKVRAQKAATN